VTATLWFLVILAACVALGWVTRRMLVSLVPLAILLGFHFALSDGELYSRVPEDVQLVVYEALVTGALLALIAALISRSASDRRGPKEHA
jgi:hypothetical protein